MKQGKYIKTVHKFECPYCAGVNNVSFGDIRDITGYDPEEHECIFCDETFGVCPDVE